MPYKDPEKERERRRKYYQENRDKILESVHKYEQENREKKREYQRQWREENLEQARERCRRWAKKNPEKINANGARRRARKMNAEIELTEHEKHDIHYLYTIAKWKSEHLGQPYHVDHIVPLDHDDCIHHPINLKVVVGSENSSKKNKLTDEAIALLPTVQKIKQERRRNAQQKTSKETC